MVATGYFSPDGTVVKRTASNHPAGAVENIAGEELHLRLEVGPLEACAIDYPKEAGDIRGEILAVAARVEEQTVLEKSHIRL